MDKADQQHVLSYGSSKGLLVWLMKVLWWAFLL